MTTTKPIGTIRTDHIRQAIFTHYHGPTDTKGSRVSASCEAGRVYNSYQHELDIAENHAAAARKLLDKLGWLEFNDFVQAGTPQGYVFVAVPHREG